MGLLKGHFWKMKLRINRRRPGKWDKLMKMEEFLRELEAEKKTSIKALARTMRKRFRKMTPDNDMRAMYYGYLDGCLSTLYATGKISAEDEVELLDEIENQAYGKDK